MLARSGASRLRREGIWYLRLHETSALAAEAELPLKVFEGFKGTAAPSDRARRRRACSRSTGTSCGRRRAGTRPCSRRAWRRPRSTRCIPLFIGRLVSLMEATDRMAALEAQWPLLAGMVVAGAGGAAAGGLGRHLDPPHGADPGRDLPDPLAEPLARGAAELAVLPERFRRAHREPRDADRARAARQRDGEHPRGLVHRRLRRHRLTLDGDRGLAARAADARLVRRLRRAALVFRAAHARSRARELGGALARHGARGRQLHQHPDGEAVRPARGRGRLRARVDRRARRRDAPPHARAHALLLPASPR